MHSACVCQCEQQCEEAPEVLGRTREGDLGAQQRADKVTIESLEHQLNKARQQLQRLQ